MLDPERIKIAESNFKKDFNEGLIRKAAPEENLMDALHDNALESLSVADFLNKKDFSPLWVIVSSYYSMYYMAKAVLISIGFKVSGEVSHRVTGDALIVLVRNKLKKQILEDLDEARTEFDEIDDLTDDIIELYDLEHKKRNDSQYVLGYEVKASKAGTSLERAKQFVYELEKLIIE